MDYDTDERSEGYEEFPKSFLRSQGGRSGSRRRRLLPLAIIGAGVVLCLVALLLVFTAGERSQQQVVHKKTLELGGAGQLPEAESGSAGTAQSRPGSESVASASQSRAVDRMESMISDLQSRIQANHDQVMKRLAELGKRVGNNTEHARQSLEKLEDLTARIGSLEMQSPSPVETESGNASAKSAQAGQAEARTQTVSQETKPAAQKQTVPSEKKFYTVKKNDTLYSIAQDNGIKLETLLEINGLEQGAVIYPGDRLLVEP